jgi:hypothetical protein
MEFQREITEEVSLAAFFLSCNIDDASSYFQTLFVTVEIFDLFFIERL